MKGGVWKGRFTLVCGYHIMNLSGFYTLSDCLDTEIRDLKTACNNPLAGVANWMFYRWLDVRKPKQTNKIQIFLLMNNPKSQTLVVHCSHFPTFLILLY